jgi:hypothetical protein
MTLKNLVQSNANLETEIIDDSIASRSQVEYSGWNWNLAYIRSWLFEGLDWLDAASLQSMNTTYTGWESTVVRMRPHLINTFWLKT